MAEIDKDALDAARRLAHQREVGRRLKDWREANGNRKIDISVKLGISHQRWHNYEIGKRPFNILLAADLKRADRTFPLEWIITGNERQMTPKLRADLQKARVKDQRANPSQKDLGYPPSATNCSG